MLIKFKRHINDTNKIVCGKEPWVFLEKTDTVTTAASTASYQIPAGITRLKNRGVIVTVDSQVYRPRPVEDSNYWNYLQSLSAGESDYPRRFFREGNKISLWQTPATAGNTITFRGTKGIVDLSLADYTTGTIAAATNADETITGASTAWTGRKPVGNQKMRIDYVNGDFQWYDISSITSDTELELVKKFEGTTFTGQTESYTLAEFSDIPEPYEMMLVYRPLAIYYQTIENPQMARTYWLLYDGGFEAGLNRDVNGLLGMMYENELQRTDGTYVEPLEADEISVEDYIIENPKISGEGWL